MDALRDDDASFITELSQSNEARDKLHPYTQTLSLTDVESCLRLEEAAFPPPERATREKVRPPLQTAPPCCSDMLAIHFLQSALSALLVALHGCHRAGPLLS